MSPHVIVLRAPDRRLGDALSCRPAERCLARTRPIDGYGRATTRTGCPRTRLPNERSAADSRMAKVPLKDRVAATARPWVGQVGDEGLPRDSYQPCKPATRANGPAQAA